MTDEADKLVRRIADLESEVASLKSRPAVPLPRGVRKRSTATILGMPLYAVAYGPDPENGEITGHAKGFFAFGDMATGVFAVGGFARGLFAFGGMAIGVLAAFGGMAIGTVAVGGGAVGVIALGGGAAGYVAIGGGAAGYYAVGGGAAGVHVIDATHQDPAAIEFLSRWIPGLEQLLPKGR